MTTQAEQWLEATKRGDAPSLTDNWLSKGPYLLDGHKEVYVMDFADGSAIFTDSDPDDSGEALSPEDYKIFKPRLEWNG